MRVRGGCARLERGHGGLAPEPGDLGEAEHLLLPAELRLGANTSKNGTRGGKDRDSSEERVKEKKRQGAPRRSPAEGEEGGGDGKCAP